MDGNNSHMDSLRDFIVEGTKEQEAFYDFSGADDFASADDYLISLKESETEDFEDEQMLTSEQLDDIDFSEIKGGDFKSKIGKLKKKVQSQKRKVLPRRGKKKRGVSQRILIPTDRKVIIEGVDRFILNNDKNSNSIKNIGYYKREKLKELVFTFNNDTGQDFDIELFNPSMPLDYLYSTSLNLNDRIIVAGGEVSYSDVLFNLLANPTMIVNAKIIIAGSNLSQQFNQPMFFYNKNIEGEQKIDPLQIQLQFDRDQYQNDIVFFDIMETLNRPFIPDGMDIAKYKVLAGMTVTLAFFYKQHSLKKFFFKEARESKEII